MPIGSYELLNDGMVNSKNAVMPSLGVDLCTSMPNHMSDFDASSCATDTAEVETQMKQITILSKVVN